MFYSPRHDCSMTSKSSKHISQVIYISSAANSHHGTVSPHEYTISWWEWVVGVGWVLEFEPSDSAVELFGWFNATVTINMSDDTAEHS